MTTRSQKMKAVAVLVSGDFEASVAENNSPENLVAGPSKTPRVEPENLEEVKTSLRKEIMSDLTKLLAENQKYKRKSLSILILSMVLILSENTTQWKSKSIIYKIVKHFS